MDKGPVSYERDVRGIPIWLLREYLEAEGGEAGEQGRILGDGWTARLTQLEDYQIGSLRVGQVRIEIEGQPGAMAQLEQVMEKKLLRGGG